MRQLVVATALLAVATAPPLAAQQVPASIVQRLTREPFNCAAPDLSLVPCGRARVADECRFRLAALGECRLSTPAAAAARTALQSCTREAAPERGGTIALALIDYDKAMAAATAAATPACPSLRGIAPIDRARLDAWNPTGPSAGWFASVKQRCAALGALASEVEAAAILGDPRSRPALAREVAAARAALQQCARLLVPAQSALAASYAHIAGQALERARRLGKPPPQQCTLASIKPRKSQRALAAANHRGAGQRKAFASRPVPSCGPYGNFLATTQTWTRKGWNNKPLPPREMRIWFPDSAKSNDGKLTPLIIFLHGNIETTWVPDAMMLATPAEMADVRKRGWNWGINVANVVAPFVQYGHMRPVIIAAPSEDPAFRAGAQNFKELDLAKVVELVFAEVGSEGVNVDLDDVSVVAWSGGGGWAGAGMNKIADEGATFSWGGTHQLRLLGLADTWQHDAALSGAIHVGLQNKGNTKTMVYALQKDLGGHKPPGYAPPSQVATFAQGMGATTPWPAGKPFPTPPRTTPYPINEAADRDIFDFYQVDDPWAVKRTAARICTWPKDRRPGPGETPCPPGLYRHTRFLHQLQAHLHEEAIQSPNAPGEDLANKPPAHRMVPLLWTLYAMPRFWAAP